MFRNVFSYGGLLLLVGAVVLATPDSGWAQRGGGHGGGGHVGGGGFGGAHIGGGGFGGARLGGYRGGFYGGGYHSGFYGHQYYRPYYGGFYGYADYGLAGYSPYFSYPYNLSSPTYDLGSFNSYGDDGPSYTNGYGLLTPPYANSQTYSLPATQSNTGAQVSVTVPSDARVWFDGSPTKSTGAVREFESPPLTSGSRYHYEIKASWTDNGRSVTQTQQVAVTPGGHANVVFPVTPTAVGQASSGNSGAR